MEIGSRRPPCRLEIVYRHLDAGSVRRSRSKGDGCVIARAVERPFKGIAIEGDAGLGMIAVGESDFHGVDHGGGHYRGRLPGGRAIEGEAHGSL